MGTIQNHSLFGRGFGPMLSNNLSDRTSGHTCKQLVKVGAFCKGPVSKESQRDIALVYAVSRPIPDYDQGEAGKKAFVLKVFGF